MVRCASSSTRHAAPALRSARRRASAAASAAAVLRARVAPGLSTRWRRAEGVGSRARLDTLCARPAARTSWPHTRRALCGVSRDRFATLCSFRYDKKFDPKAADFAKMRVKELRKVCDDEGIDTKGLVEKDEYIKKVKAHFKMEL